MRRTPLDEVEEYWTRLGRAYATAVAAIKRAIAEGYTEEDVWIRSDTAFQRGKVEAAADTERKT
jgi:hypothetical protein